MLKVTDLPYGWSLMADAASAEPWLVNKDGRERTPFEAAMLPEARSLYVHMQRHLNVMDMDWKGPGQELRFRAADAGVFAMMMALKRAGFWNDELRESAEVAYG